MNTLFSLEPAYPPGFQYLPHFLSVKEEEALLEMVQSMSFHNFQFQGYEAKRRVASFGWDWNFDRQELVKGKDVPAKLEWLIKRVGEQLSISPALFAELLVTEYPVGSVINWHRDAPPFALIAGISLQTDCTFKLRPYDKEKQGRKTTITVPVKPRSLYVMEGEARDAWQHSTLAVQKARYSITLRTFKGSF